MARIIVAADPTADRRTSAARRSRPVLLDERVSSIHLSDGHAAEQLIERLAWAVTDAEETERARCPPPADAHPAGRRRLPGGAGRRPLTSGAPQNGSPSTSTSPAGHPAPRAAAPTSRASASRPCRRAARR